MATPHGSERVSRRGFVKLVGAAVAAIGLGLSRPREALARPAQPRGRTMAVYYLDPEWGAGAEGCPATPDDTHQASHACHACKACHGHAAHKRWASESCVQRAHLGCRCVIRSQQVSVGVYRRTFGVAGAPNFRCVFDDRWA